MKTFKIISRNKLLIKDSMTEGCKIKNNNLLSGRGRSVILNKETGRLFLFVIVMMLFPVFSCSSGTTEKGTVTAGNTVISVEIAYTDSDRARGLMNRKKLDPDSGMIFVFSYDRKLSFWMKNTSIPLSIAYISSDSVIREIKDMKPFSLSPVNSKNSVRYALEVEKGYFEKNGIKAGDKLIFSETILQALEKAED